MTYMNRTIFTHDFLNLYMDIKDKPYKLFKIKNMEYMYMPERPIRIFDKTVYIYITNIQKPNLAAWV